MSKQRFMILTVGPVVIVGLLYWLIIVPAGRTANAAREEIPPRAVTGSLTRIQQDKLEANCQAVAKKLATKLCDDCKVVVSSPFIIGGNLAESELQRYDRSFLQPIRKALETSYFDRKPNEPVTILIFTNEESFRKHARKLDGEDRGCYSGYYQRKDRRIVLNIDSGEGTLAHELTHALGHFDFHQMPEWFDEGLASLHEQCEYSDDDLRLIGLRNWRQKLLIPELKSQRLESIETLMNRQSVRGNREAIHYAQSRYFCLYLQKRQLLSNFYRKFRATSITDPTGVTALKEILHVESLDKFNSDFQKWVLQSETVTQ
jgi:hypothetical protein